MRDNLRKKDIINSIYMQIGFSKKVSENLFDDILDQIVENLIKYKKLLRSFCDKTWRLQYIVYKF